MKFIILFFISFSVFFSSACAQEDSTIFSRIRAISNSGIDFFNVDGIEVTSQTLSGDFSKKNILRKFKRYAIREADLNQPDSSLGLENYYAVKAEQIAPNVLQNTSYYFINTPTGIKAVSFGSLNKADKTFERNFLKLLINDKIPKDIYEPLKIDSINFAGRKLPLGNSCRWMGINNVQCPYYGQMNWSVHKTFQDASASADNQYKVIQAKKQGKVIAEEEVEVVFEGSEVKAKKVVYDVKGVASLLVGMSGAKTLTIYFVAAPVRQNFVSCVMSFWNNDTVNPSGLPPLLEQVMKLQK